MSSFVRSAVGLAVGLALAVTGTAWATPGSLRIELTAAGEERAGPAEAVAVRFTLINEGSRAARVLRWHTPLLGVQEDLFEMFVDGEPVEYTGPRFKRPAPGPPDFIRLEAGASLVVELDLSQFYDFSRSGEYTVRYRRERFGFAGAESAGSADLTLWVERASESLAEAQEGTAAEALAAAFSGCSAARRTTLTSALAAAEQLSALASATLDHAAVAARPSEPRYKEWFGAYDATRYATVSRHFAAIRNVFARRTVSFFCDCTEPAYAYVYASRPYQIHLCAAFWTAPTTGGDSKAGTLIHEVSHFTAVASTDDWAYGPPACRALTRTPAKAIDNADSHEYFAEASYR